MSPTLALYLVTFGALLLVAVLLDDIADRIRVPGILLVLLLGLLTDNDINPLSSGGDGPHLLSLQHANEIAQIALVLLLFFGGLTTNWSQLRDVLKPALRLATVGALITAVLITAVVMVLGSLPITERTPTLPVALFVGAMVCSTDSSAVLALLRPLADRLPRRVIDLLECESGFNDPVAVVLAGVAMAMALGDQTTTASSLVVDASRQFMIGVLLGFLGGSLASQLLSLQRKFTSPPLQAVVSLAVLFLLVGLTQLLGGSGILAAFVAGLVLGNGSQWDRDVLEQAHAGFAKMAELMLFLCLGLVVQGEKVVDILLWVVVLFLVMVVARWLMVEMMLMKSGFSRPEHVLIAASGLRGAVPVAVAIQAAASDVPWGKEMPPLALGVVLLGLFVQGFSLVPLARRLGLASSE